jgi:catechol 2,3-dioxygenase-like lactoylglutathione lyase family enzyme
MPAWTFCVPQLPVRDVPAAQEWYRDVLGLEINWLWEDNFGSVGQDCVELFLYESDDRHPVYVSIFVADVDEVHTRVVVSGGEVVSPLEDKPWNVREFTVRDPDGHLLRIGSSVEGERATAFSFPEEARA